MLLAGGAFDQRRPALSFDGANFLVVYEETSSAPTIGMSAKRITPDLSVLDATPITLSTAGTDAGYPDVSFDGLNFVAAWTESISDNADVVVRRITPAGTALPAIPLTNDNDPATDFRDAAVVFDGANTMVAYARYGLDESSIRAQRIDLNGAIVDVAPIVFDTNVFLEGGLGSPRVAWDGAHYVVAYSETDEYSRTGKIRRFDATGLPISPGQNIDTAPDVAVIGEIAFVVAIESRVDDPTDTTPAVYTSGYGPNGEAIAGGPLAGVPGPQLNRTISFGNGIYLLVWADHTGTFASRFGSNLQAIAGEPIALGFATDAPVEVAFNGTNFLLAGVDSAVNGEGTRIVTITPNGDVLRSEIVQEIQPTVEIIPSPFGPVPVKRIYRAVDIVSSGSTSLVVARSSLLGSETTISTLIVDVAGVPITPVSTAASSPSLVNSASAAWDGSQYHIVWSDGRNGNNDVYGTRVAANGTPLNTAGSPLATSLARELSPKIAASPSEIVVVWQRTQNSSDRIQALRLGNNGVPIGSAIDVGAGTGYEPDVVINGHPVIMWSEPAGADRTAMQTARFQNGTVTPLGTVATVASTSASRAMAPAVPGVVAVTFNDIDPAVNEFSTAFWRIFYS